MNIFKQLRKKAKIKTVKEASEKLECSESMINKIETNVRFPSRKLLIKICEIYKCTPNDVLQINKKSA